MDAALAHLGCLLLDTFFAAGPPRLSIGGALPQKPPEIRRPAIDVITLLVPRLTTILPAGILLRFPQTHFRRSEYPHTAF
jgi:hypothetical protein